MKLGLSNKLVTSPINSVPLSERASLGVSFDRSRYTNPAGFANQTAVGSSGFKLQSYAGPSPTFTRASAATFRGSNGLIQFAPENFLTNSGPVIGSYTAGTRTLNYGDGPFQGTRSALLTSSDVTYFVNYVPALMDQAVCTSIYVKRGTNSNVGLSMHTGTNANYTFNFDTEQIVQGYSPRHISSGVQKLSDGWYRIWFTIRLQSNDHWPKVSSNGTEVFGIQAERGVMSPRPYISTTSAAVYGPRFEYATNGEPLGLLMEEQSTNLLSYSEQFNNAYWSKFNTTIANDSTLSPRGMADARIVNAASSTSTVYRDFTASYGRYSASFYFKSGTLGIVIIQLRNSADTLGGAATFDLTNLTAVATNIGVTTGTTASIQDVGNGWRRCIVNADLPSSSCFVVANSASGNYYIWGAQLEAKPFATSYIPTVGGTATRNADLLSVPIGSWYNSDTGTIIVEGTRFNAAVTRTAGFDSLFDFYSDIAVSSVLRHAAIDYEQFEAFTTGFVSTGSAYVDLEMGPNAPIKFGVTYDSPTSTFTGAVNNYSTATLNGPDPLETPTVLRIGLSTDNSYWTGYIKSISYTPKYWPDKIQALTALP